LNNTCLTFQNVAFSYPESNWTLTIPSLTLGAERVTCLVGPNGSGKSTLIRLAAGLLFPGTGTISLNGDTLSALRRRDLARAIAYLPQESPPLYDYPVEMVARMGRYIHTGWTGALSPQDEQAVENALRSVQMTEKKDRSLAHISGGERRRALIASVLAQQARLLLLDEPTASLDVHHAASVMQLLAHLAQDGPQVVMVTHDINLAAMFATRMLLISDGHILVDGTPAEVIQPQWMAAAYGPDVMVYPHPELDIPMLLPKHTHKASPGGTTDG